MLVEDLHNERTQVMEVKTSALNYYNYGTAAPSLDAMVDAQTKRVQTPSVKSSGAKAPAGRLEKVKAVAGAKTVPGISVFAVLGTLFVSVLMVFVVLAQINFNETAGETARINMQLSELAAKQKSLELAFESTIDIKEVERFARDELGMSRPENDQLVIISATPSDSAMRFNNGQERGMQGFGTFLRSLTEYFR